MIVERRKRLKPSFHERTQEIIQSALIIEHEAGKLPERVNPSAMRLELKNMLWNIINIAKLTGELDEITDSNRYITSWSDDPINSE